MTEKQIRAQVVATAEAWLGAKTGSAQHKEIIKIYNAQRPLPRGTQMQENWAWCAVFVSAVALKLGYRDIMPTEMSCHQMMLLYKQLGRWIENDAYVPSAGDVIFYDWQDGTNYAATDNTGTPDHVGIVTSCDGITIRVIEGNVSNEVGTRVLVVNGRYIRGFGVPDFASKATEEEKPADKTDDLARKIVTEINDSGLDAAAVLAKVSALLGAKPAEPEKPAEAPAEPEKKTPTAAEIDAMARDVIRGKYGNGARRRALLGDNYDAVQKRVNEILRG
nr:MAG TPA: peptidoglycan hydrolase [Caudoviricetes sp.]